MNQKVKINKIINTIDDFKHELQIIKDKGFHKSKRSGPTGIGKTLEDLLGIEENCIATPDLDTVELKSARKDSSSMLTLTTKSPDKRGANSLLRDTYGYKTEESIALNPNINILHTTVNGIDFNTLNGEPFLKLTFKDEKMYLEHAEHGILENVYWSEDSLTKAFKKKYPYEKLYYVKAQTKTKDGEEYFLYEDAYFLQKFSAEKMLNNIKSGIIDVDIRIGIHAKGKNIGKSHDHGTAIRISPDKLDLCFDKTDKIL